MNERERSIVVGCVLGDGFLQMTGIRNARLRLEHSAKQRSYIAWKWAELKRYVQDRPKRMTRYNPIWRNTYLYYRCQSHSSPQFGKLCAQFYTDHHKRIPVSINKLLTPLACAVWYMDDGYYYRRDRTAYIYLSHLSQQDIMRLTQALREKFNLSPRLEKKKTGALNFKFPVAETRKLIHIIAPHVISSMRYKIGGEPRID